MQTFRKIGLSAALVGTTLVGGALGASFLGTAGAQTDSSSSTTAASGSWATAPDPSQGGHTANGIADFSTASIEDGMR